MRLAIFSRGLGPSSEIPRTAMQVAAWFVAIAFANATIAVAEDEFPYKAFVAKDRTQLLSGPGDDHYPTDELNRGVEVEIFRRVEGGWLGVRPPQSSFSWVSQRDLKINDDADRGEVVGTAAVSWIGSNVRDVSDHRWLIKLDRGESVSLLGKERRRMVGSGRSEVFYKISPPSGEFRWLHEDDVVQEKSEVAVIRDPDVELADFRVALRGTPRAAPAATTPVATLKAESEPESPPAVIQPDPPKEQKKDAFVSRDKQFNARESVSELALLPKRSSKSSAKSLESSLVSARAGDLESKLRDLEAQLSLVASQPAESWNFASLRASAEELSAAGTSTLDRARVQLYLDKLAEFEGLKSRHALMDPKPTTASSASKSTTNAAKSGANVDPRFDGTGWLLPVHSTKQASPPYALLDKEGNILQFVSPAPGLNLNRYLKKEIGVFGQKDQSMTLEKPHLTAHRIVELDRHR